MNRSSEPGFLSSLRRSQIQWSDLDADSRRRIREALAQDFGNICAYCERQCEPQVATSNPHSREEIEHFRPRSRFPELSFEWLNLVYACHRCNHCKDNSWPGFDDGMVNQQLFAEDARYTPVSEYVSPNATDGQPSASEFFSYDVDTGEIMPLGQLPPIEWSMARRTIRDIDLNDRQLGENDPKHLWRLRRAHLDLLREAVNAEDDDVLALLIIREFILPDSPFSSFVLAYVETLGHEFPLA